MFISLVAIKYTFTKDNFDNISMNNIQLHTLKQVEKVLNSNEYKMGLISDVEVFVEVAESIPNSFDTDSSRQISNESVSASYYPYTIRNDFFTYNYYTQPSIVVSSKSTGSNTYIKKIVQLTADLLVNAVVTNVVASSAYTVFNFFTTLSASDITWANGYTHSIIVHGNKNVQNTYVTWVVDNVTKIGSISELTGVMHQDTYQAWGKTLKTSPLSPMTWVRTPHYNSPETWAIQGYQANLSNFETIDHFHINGVQVPSY